MIHLFKKKKKFLDYNNVEIIVTEHFIKAHESLKTVLSSRAL